MPDIKFLKTMKVLPKLKTIPRILVLEAPSVNRSLLLERAKLLRLKGDGGSTSYAEDEERLTYTEGPFELSLSRASGALRYLDRSRWQVDDGKSRVNFQDNDAVKIAKRFLAQYKLVPTDECELLKVSHLRVGTLERGATKAAERVIDVAVVFQRVIDNLPVLGPGGKAAVYVAHDGEVTGCEITWRGIKSVHTRLALKDLQPPEFAEGHLSRYWTPLAIPKIEVLDMRFGYFELGPSESQRYIQPAYVMPMTLSCAEGKMTMKTVHVVPAAVKPVGELMPPPKPQVKEPVRKG
jgi:hypothetical protein